MAKNIERQKAQILRESGLSIKDISLKLNVSKSSVSMWCQDIVLSEEAVQNIVKTSKKKCTAGILRYTESLRKKRQANIIDDKQKGLDMLGKLSSRDVMCIGIGLYWGEGYKKGNQEFGFTNSDPQMIVFYIKWLRNIFNIDKKELILRISINELHEYRIKEVENFWVKNTGVPFSQFTKTSLIKTKSKKIYENQEQHFGTLRIKVRRGTKMRRMILGMIQGLLST
jgi:predicted transcriptional regulator